MKDETGIIEKLDQKIGAYKIPIALSLVGVVLIIGGVISSGIKPKITADSPAIANTYSDASSPASYESIKVDISGAVNNPGVYTLELNDRVEDAIKAAGGVKVNANAEYIAKTLNLSQKLSDGYKLYIPFSGESYNMTTSVTQSTGKIDINNSTASQLDSLPGVGEVTSQKIIQGRPYSSPADLLTRKIVSSSVYNKIKDLIQ